jgi:hypothetical protein
MGEEEEEEEVPNEFETTGNVVEKREGELA